MKKVLNVFLGCSILVISQAQAKETSKRGEDLIPSVKLPDKILDAPLREKKTDFSPNHPFNLALIATYMKNPELRSKVRNQYVTDENVSQVMGSFRPKIQATATASQSMTNTVNPSNPQGSTTTDRPISGGISISQSLFEGGKSLHELDREEKKVLAGRFDFTNTEQSVMLGAANAYFDLWLKKALVELNKKNVEAKKKRLKESQARFDVGELTLTDLAQAESQLAEAVAKEISAKADESNARSTYLKVVGEEPIELLPPPPLEKVFSLPQSKQELIQLSLKNNPAVQKAAYLRDAAKDDIKVKKSALLPSVSAEAAANQELATNGPTNRRQSLQGVVRMTIPLYQTGAEYSAVRQSIETEKQLKLDFMRVSQEATEVAGQAWENFIAAKARMDQFHSQIKAAQLALEGTYQEHLVGERTLLDVFEAENKFLEVQTSYLQTQKDYLTGGYQLLAVIGHMTARHLKLPVEQYDLEGHYKEVKGKLFGF